MSVNSGEVQFTHKRYPIEALEWNEKRKKFQSKMNFKKKYLLNTQAWTALFLMKAGRIEESQLNENLNIIKEEYSKRSLFPQKLLARYYSLKAANVGKAEKYLLLSKMEKCCDYILDFLSAESYLKSDSFTEREIAASYIDIAQFYQHYRCPFKEEMERLDKATQISLRYGYAGQAKQLLKLIENKRFDPGEYTVKSLQELASTIKGDKYYR